MAVGTLGFPPQCGLIPNVPYRQFHFPTRGNASQNSTTTSINMNPNVQAAITATKKKVPSKPKGKNASATAVVSSGLKAQQPSFGEKPSGPDIPITQCVIRSTTVYSLLYRYSFIKLLCMNAGYLLRTFCMKA